MQKPAILALADGTVFRGRSIGIAGSTTGEIVFNTAITGYQEILTDPSYKKQIVTLTYPHIGNVGVNEADVESNQVHASGLVIRDLPLTASNWRMQQTLPDYLEQNKVVAIADIDTRALTRRLREHGAIGACILGESDDADAAIEQARAFPGLTGMDLAREVSTPESYTWSAGPVNLGTNAAYVAPSETSHIVAVDFGVKHMMLRLLIERGARITVVPATTSAEQIAQLNPQGVLLTNGPGDPAACDYAVAMIKDLLEQDVPILGICLGCQLLALASGAQTMKMKYGHHGANHPVQDLRSKRVFITSQNHGFCIEDELPDNITVTHRSLFDNTIQGIALSQKPVMGFQGHPEASPGPNDLHYLFDEFMKTVREYQG